MFDRMKKMLDALDYECFGTTVSLVKNEEVFTKKKKNEEENIVTKLTNLYKSLEKSKCVNKLSTREKENSKINDSETGTQA